MFNSRDRKCVRVCLSTHVRVCVCVCPCMCVRARASAAKVASAAIASNGLLDRRNWVYSSFCLQ